MLVPVYRIVLDTNVLIDGVRDEYSAAWQIVQYVLDKKINALVSRQIQREYDRIVAREIVDREYKERLSRLYKACTNVSVYSVPRVILDDPEDDKILATAKQGRADSIVSSDRHLLDLDLKEPPCVMDPEEFLNMWKQEYGDEWSDFAKMVGI